MIPVWIQAITTVLHFGWCELFIKKMQMEVVGAAICMNITYILNMIVIDVYITVSKTCKDTWIVFNKEAFRGYWEYL